ncbi:MAG: radical SAM protein [Lachnospiraceae bacterium]|nr:radical SAM protein [Lachnospiraceae bacterium]
MRIGLIDVDGHNFPNIPLMKLSAWHKQSGDQVEWYDPVKSGHMDKVYLSKVFSFTKDYEQKIDADEIVRGGSGYCISLAGGREIYDHARDRPLPPEIEHIYPDYAIYFDDEARELDTSGAPTGRLSKKEREKRDTAYGFLTRGCPRHCSFCHVGAKEGCRSEKVADLSEFWRGQRNIVLCDPNLLACPQHIELLDQAARSGAKVDFNQGLDARLLNDKNMEVLQRIRLKSVHFAYDRYQDREIIEKQLRWFHEETGCSKDKGKVTVYILVNYDTTLQQDIERIQFCRALRFSPYPMIYDKEHADPVYRRLQRWCSNYIFWKTPSFEDYRG